MWFSLALAAEPVLSVPDAVTVPSVTLDEGPLSIHLGAATATTIRLGDRRIGLLLDGAGTADARFADRGDAIAFADRQVLWLGRSKAEMAPIAHQEMPYSDAARRVIVLSGDAAWLDGLLAGSTPAAVPADALAVVSRRVPALEKATDAVPDARPHGSWLVVDALLTRRLGYAIAGAQPAGDDDRWLALIRDSVPGATVRTEDLGAVGWIEKTPVWRPIALPAWVEPRREENRGRYEMLSTDVTVEVLAKGGHADVAVREVHQLMSRRAESTLLVFGAKSAARHTIASLSIDGISVPLVDTEEWTVTLPKPIGPGDTITVELVSKHRIDVVTENQAGEWYLPLTHSFGSVAADYVVHVPLPDKVDVAVSGRTERDAAGVISRGRGQPWLALGAWMSLVSPAVGRFPSINAHVFGKDVASLPTFGPFMRTVLAYDENLLPPLGQAELDIVQMPGKSGGFTWTSRPELVTIQQMTVIEGEGSTRSELPHLEETVMAHELAHQWWGGSVRQALAEDRWISETLAETYACLFVAAAFKPQTCEVRRDNWRKTWISAKPPASSASLRRARTAAWTPTAYEYGPYVMLGMLRPRLGDDAFLGGLYAYAKAYGGTGQASAYTLEAAFAATSKKSQADFFDYWVDAGFLPAIDVVWGATGADVTSSVPFGTFDLPIEVITPGGSRVVWVDVVDGAGRVAWDEPPTKVKVDPDHHVLATAIRVKQNKP